MALVASNGFDFTRQLCEALGISGPVRRIVIESAVSSAPTVYIQRFITKSEAEAITARLAEGPANRPQVVEVECVDVDEIGVVRWAKK